MHDQNTSHAVMSQRDPASDKLDFFPTPPWATRALCERLIASGVHRLETVWEPACGAGHMARPLKEYFTTVVGSDIHDYGFGELADFLDPAETIRGVDWVITNPPFSSAADFALRGLQVAGQGVALLVRTQFLEGAGRWKTLFEPYTPATIMQFVERVPMHKGRLLRQGSTATSYCWIVWLKNKPAGSRTAMTWISPCRKRLEKDADYSDASE